MVDERMLIKADIMSDKYGKIKITTTDGRILIGTSWGINPCFNDDGDEYPYKCLSFKQDNGFYDELTNEEIASVEKV